MAFENQLPVRGFPGFTHSSVVAPQVREIAVTFNAESQDALTSVADEDVAWADRGSRVTQGVFDVKIPVRLPSGMMFTPFNGTRSYNRFDIAAPIVQTNPLQLNFEWPMIIDQSGNIELRNFYNASGVAQDMVNAARFYKAQLVASLTYEGITNPVLGLVAKALTIPQPGFPSGLPLFSDGVNTPLHYAHPFKDTSGRFANLFPGFGKITDTDVFGNMLTLMSRVPHAVLPNVSLGCKVTDIIGPTHMLDPFYRVAIQNLALEVRGAQFAATTNQYNPALLEKAMNAGQFVGASGLTPWRFWIAPQLDNHPYVLANPDAHMWLAVSRKEGTGNRDTWAELAAPSKEFVPIVQLLGDGSEEARKSGMIRMLGDLHAGVGAGLPHFVQMYWETTPA